MPASDDIMIAVARELSRATAEFPPFNSPHEGHAVIAEEMDELWDLVRANDARGEAARKEAIQIAAMAIRYVRDLTIADASDLADYGHDKMIDCGAVELDPDYWAGNA